MKLETVSQHCALYYNTPETLRLTFNKLKVSIYKFYLSINLQYLQYYNTYFFLSFTKSSTGTLSNNQCLQQVARLSARTGGNKKKFTDKRKTARILQRRNGTENCEVVCRVFDYVYTADYMQIEYCAFVTRSSTLVDVSVEVKYVFTRYKAKCSYFCNKSV